MFKAMSKITYKNKELLASYQDFETGTIKIFYDNTEYICDMFQDNDGEIGFIFDDTEFYFTYMKML